MATKLSRRANEIPSEVMDAIERVTSHDPRIGEVIADRYRIVRLLAEGGMGTVYVGEHVELGLPVAIKLLPVASTDEASVKRFRREAIAAAQLRSPHVVQVFDFGRTRDGAFYLVMELLEGSDLSTRLALHGLPTASETIDILRQLACALDHAHALGIVHRDLKPENVLVIERGAAKSYVKVLDFGVAKSFLRGGGTVTDIGTVLGTPAFMAPEQALGMVERVGPASDRYALAAVALELLTGELPYPYEGASRTIQALVDESPRLPSALGLEVEGLDEVFERAMAREPGERFGSSAAFVDALEIALGDMTIEPTPTSGIPRESLIRSLRPRPRKNATGAATVALSAAEKSQPQAQAQVHAQPQARAQLPMPTASSSIPSMPSLSAMSMTPWWASKTALAIAVAMLGFAAGWASCLLAGWALVGLR